MRKPTTEKAEVARLRRIYKDLPPNKLAIADGLIVQAARLRVRLDELWEDIQENGSLEPFVQSSATEPYLRERPASKMFTATDKSYQSIIKQLDALTPVSAPRSKLAEMLDDD